MIEALLIINEFNENEFGAITKLTLLN